MRRGLVADSVRTARGRLRYSVAVFVFMGCSLPRVVSARMAQISATGVAEIKLFPVLPM
jgi:hypothetical protein